MSNLNDHTRKIKVGRRGVQEAFRYFSKCLQSKDPHFLKAVGISTCYLQPVSNTILDYMFFKLRFWAVIASFARLSVFKVIALRILSVAAINLIRNDPGAF